MSERLSGKELSKAMVLGALAVGGAYGVIYGAAEMAGIKSMNEPGHKQMVEQMQHHAPPKHLEANGQQYGLTVPEGNPVPQVSPAPEGLTVPDSNQQP